MTYLLPAIVALFSMAPVFAEDTPSKHKLSDWKIGEVLFGEEPTKTSMRGKEVKYPLEKPSADSRGKIEQALAASKKTGETEE